AEQQGRGKEEGVRGRNLGPLVPPPGDPHDVKNDPRILRKTRKERRFLLPVLRGPFDGAVVVFGRPGLDRRQRRPVGGVDRPEGARSPGGEPPRFCATIPSLSNWSSNIGVAPQATRGIIGRRGGRRTSLARSRPLPSPALKPAGWPGWRPPSYRPAIR